MHLDIMKYLLALALLFCSIGGAKKDLSYLIQESKEAFHKELEKEYGIHLVEEKGVGRERLKRLVLHYNSSEEGDLLKARLLIHRVTENLFEKIREAEKKAGVKEGLQKKDLEITISFLEKKSERAYPFTAVSHVSLLEEWIHYTTSDPMTGEISLLHREEFTSLLTAL